TDSLNLEDYKKVKRWKTPIQKRERWWNYQDISLDVQSPGVYLVAGAISGKYAYTVVTVSRYAMILKRSPKILLAFVVDKESGSRVEDFPLVVFRRGQKLAEGQTTSGVFYLGDKRQRNTRVTRYMPLDEFSGECDLL